MKKLLFGSILFLTLSLVQTQNANGQDTIQRAIGISGTIQSSQFGIMIPIWVAKNFSISPAIDFQWGESLGADIGIGIVPKIYFSAKKLSPYLGLRGGAIFFTPDKDNDGEAKTTDWLVGLAVGAEYFFDPRFSIGVEAQANFTKSDENSMRFNNPGNWNFNLGTMVSANVYFLRSK
jgi:hypothetical protein